MSEREASLGALVDRLVRRLNSIDHHLRASAARSIFETLPPSDVVEVLDVLLERKEKGDRKVLHCLPAITTALSELGELDAASAIYAEALERNLHDVARLLMRPHPARDFDPRKETGVDHEMRARTVGMRRQMARSADPVLMVRLQSDPDPGVIRNLLNHPRLTEPEVVRMAARRPGRPDVLAEIFKSRKWSARRVVRKALANNPYTPTEMALKLVPLLTLQDIRELAADGEIHEEVRRSAKARLVAAKHRRKIAKAAANLADLEPEGDA